MSTQDRFVMVRVAGRGDYTVYHPLDAEGNNPLCGAAIVAEQWDLTSEDRAQAGGRRAGRRCCQRCAAKEHPHGTE